MVVAAERHLITNRDGYIVDLETGEVVDEQPLSYDPVAELPPGLPRDEFEHRLRAAVYNVRPPGEKPRIVTFKLPKWLLERVDEEARRRGLAHRSELIREALVFYLLRQDSILAMVKRLRDLYAARGFLYAVRPLAAMAAAYLDPALRSDVKRVEEELEAAIKHVEEELAKLHRMLGLW